jgi:hypothetical protein
MGDEFTHNFPNDLPIDIDTLAALVEGDLGCQEADDVRERLLAIDPEIAARVEMMSRDRVLLRALGDEQPSAGLAESVIARLEREALLGLAQGEPSGGALPLSTVRTIRPSRWAGAARWMISPAGAGLGLAAGLALAIGITLQMLPSGSGGVSPTPIPIAEGDTTFDDRSVAIDSNPRAPVVGADVPDPPVIGADTRVLTVESTTPKPGPDMTFTADLDRALALLAEGRLLVRVQSGDPETTVAQLGRFAERSGRPGEAWRLEADATESVVAAMDLKFAPIVSIDEPVMFASGDLPPANLETTNRVQLVSTPSPLEAVYLADARLDRAAMASLRSALSLGNGQHAVFEELAQPLELPRVLTPDSVLWWGRPASEWSERGYVPIVVERVER